MDARVLLRHVLQCPASRLAAWPEQILDAVDWARFRELVERRAAGEPVAYLTGEREFYGRNFMVTPAVLIPRPDTELLVELALAHVSGRRQVRVLDMGTGSGALAVTLALELGEADVTALDRSRETLWVAMANAARLGARVLRAERLVFRAGEERFSSSSCPTRYIASADPHLEGATCASSRMPRWPPVRPGSTTWRRSSPVRRGIWRQAAGVVRARLRPGLRGARPAGRCRLRFDHVVEGPCRHRAGVGRAGWGAREIGGGRARAIDAVDRAP